MKAWLTAGAAQYAGVSRDTIYTACQRREIRHARVGAIQLTTKWIDAWLERHVRDSEDRPTIGRTRVSVDLVSETTS